MVNGSEGWAVVDLAELRLVAKVADGPPVGQLEVPDTVAVSPDGRTAALGRARDVVLVDVRNGDELERRRLPDGDGMLTGTWVDDRTVVVGGWDGVLHVLDGRDLSTLAPPRLVAAGWLTDLVASPDGRLVAGMDTDGKVSLYDTAAWRPLGRPVLQVEDWSGLSFTADGRTLRVWSGGNGRVAMVMRPEAWLRGACRVAGRELTRDEWRDVHPDQQWRPTCGPGGQAAVDAVRAAG